GPPPGARSAGRAGRSAYACSLTAREAGKDRPERGGDDVRVDTDPPSKRPVRPVGGLHVGDRGSVGRLADSWLRVGDPVEDDAQVPAQTVHERGDGPVAAPLDRAECATRAEMRNETGPLIPLRDDLVIDELVRRRLGQVLSPERLPHR